MLFCLTCSNNQAQQGFRYKAALDSVPASGFYQVTISPALGAALQPDLRDLRIVDPAGKQVPYILKSDLPAFNENSFAELPVRSAKKEADGQTHVVIENTLQQPLNELLLVIKNTDADRTVTLSGSDDGKLWFVIKEHAWLNSFFSNSSDRFVQTLSFPKSSYRYFTVIINGKDLLPVNIVKAGVYQQTLYSGKYLPVPAPVLLQKDSSDKSSYIDVQFTSHYFLSRLVLQAQGPKFYERVVEIYNNTNGLQPVPGLFTIRSDKETILPVSLKTNRILIRIINNDNPPLQIKSIEAFQLHQYLLAYLEKETAYTLQFSDSAAIPPVYDLQSFKDSITSNATTLQYGGISNNALPAQKATGQTAGNKAILWLAIGTAIVVLLMLTFKLTGEIKKSN